MNSKNSFKVSFTSCEMFRRRTCRLMWHHNACFQIDFNLSTQHECKITFVGNICSPWKSCLENYGKKVLCSLYSKVEEPYCITRNTQCILSYLVKLFGRSFFRHWSDIGHEGNLCLFQFPRSNNEFVLVS